MLAFLTVGAVNMGDALEHADLVAPLMPYFALVVVLAQRYQKDAGFGTVVAMMLPYCVAVWVVWILLFLVWEVLGLPFGPG